jgi:hypothetical protein
MRTRWSEGLRAHISSRPRLERAAAYAHLFGDRSCDRGRGVLLTAPSGGPSYVRRTMYTPPHPACNSRRSSSRCLLRGCPPAVLCIPFRLRLLGGADVAGGPALSMCLYSAPTGCRQQEIDPRPQLEPCPSAWSGTREIAAGHLAQLSGGCPLCGVNIHGHRQRRWRDLRRPSGSGPDRGRRGERTSRTAEPCGPSRSAPRPGGHLAPVSGQGDSGTRWPVA